MSNNSARAGVGRGAAASHPAAGGPGKGRGTGRHVASCGPGAGRGRPLSPARPAPVHRVLSPRPLRPSPARAHRLPAALRPLRPLRPAQRPAPCPPRTLPAHPCRTTSIAQHPQSVSIAPRPRVKPHSRPPLARPLLCPEATSLQPALTSQGESNSRVYVATSFLGNAGTRG